MAAIKLVTEGCEGVHGDSNIRSCLAVSAAD